jgi:exonuclease III
VTRHTTANIGRGRPAAQRDAFERVLDLNGRQGIVGWQEIGESDGPVNEPGRLRRAFRRAVWRTAAMTVRTPVTWNRLTWQCLGVELVKVMKGIDRVSPARYVVIVRLKHRRTGRLLTRINTHTVAGAFNGTTDRHEPRRREGWEHHWEELQEIVEQEAATGADIVISGDFNRQHPPLPIHELHPRAVLAAKSHTDHLIAVPAAGHRAVVDQVRRATVGIDFHVGLSARIRFRDAA